jgi:hypothetical protein
MTTFSLILNWNPEHGGDQNIPCGTVRVTPGWHINAIDLVFAVCQPAQREIAAKTLRRLIGKQLLGESDITYVVLSRISPMWFFAEPGRNNLFTPASMDNTQYSPPSDYVLSKSGRCRFDGQSSTMMAILIITRRS